MERQNIRNWIDGNRNKFPVDCVESCCVAGHTFKATVALLQASLQAITKHCIQIERI